MAPGAPRRSAAAGGAARRAVGQVVGRPLVRPRLARSLALDVVVEDDVSVRSCMRIGAGTDPRTPFNPHGNAVNEQASMPGSALDAQEPPVAGQVTLREVGVATAVR